MQKEKRNTNTNTNTKIGTWIETHLVNCFDQNPPTELRLRFCKQNLNPSPQTLENPWDSRFEERVMEWKGKWVSRVLGLWDEWIGKTDLEIGEGELAFGRGLVIQREKRGLVMKWKVKWVSRVLVYEMTKSVKRIWRWVRVNRQRQRLGDSDSGLVIGEKSKAWWQRLGDQREKRGLEIAAWWLERKREARWRERETGDGSPIL